MGVNDGDLIVKAEELHTEDPTALSRIGDAIGLRSQEQNSNRASKRARTAAPGGGGGWGGDDAWGGGWDSWDSKGWGKGGNGCKGKGGGWGAWAQPTVDLFIEGVPPDATSRELHHIFRQYAGFQELRRVYKGEGYLTFVTFATPAQAEFVANALEGYVFDADNMQESSRLSVRLSHGGKGGKGKK